MGKNDKQYRTQYRKQRGNPNKYAKWMFAQNQYGDQDGSCYLYRDIEYFADSIRGSWTWHDSLKIPIKFKGRVIKDQNHSQNKTWHMQCVFNESGDTCPVSIYKIKNGCGFLMHFSIHSFNITIQGHLHNGTIIGQCAYYPMQTMDESYKYLKKIDCIGRDVYSSIDAYDGYQGVFMWTR